jgi:hypothetical protein
VAGVCLAAVLLGCAAELARRPASYAPLAADAEASLLRVPRAVAVTPSTGYTKTIRAGSTWRRVGATREGDVYRPVGEVFAVEGANMHEAYLVVASGRVVGFYLPGERAFAPLPESVPLPTE